MITVRQGDCVEVLRARTGPLFDSCVCDPPCELGFMGRAWDSSGVAFQVETWRAVFDQLKPGAYLVAFSGTRTYHRMAVAIEDAGFEIRDQLAWVYGSGFPKSLDVAKAIDSRKDWTALPTLQLAIRTARKKLGISQSEAARRVGMIGPTEKLGGGGFMWFETGMRAPTREQWPRVRDALALGDAFDDCFEAVEREVIGHYKASAGGQNMQAGLGQNGEALPPGEITKASSPAAIEWQGWGTALKPAWEPICLARKPLIGTVAANVLAHGTGGLNIDACRVENAQYDRAKIQRQTNPSTFQGNGGNEQPTYNVAGRFPANLIHDGSDEVVLMFPDAGGGYGKRGAGGGNGVYSPIGGTMQTVGFGDEGSAARFFYSAKAGPLDRLGSEHTTVKPVDVMRWLVRLVTRPGGLLLDPFAGSGTTGIAALAEGFSAELIDLIPEHVADIETKLAHLRGEGARIVERHLKRKAARATGKGTLL